MARAMKDSGIPWIGEIPEEWGISRVGLHFDIILGKMLCSVQPSDDYTFIAINSNSFLISAICFEPDGRHIPFDTIFKLNTTARRNG